MALYSIVCVVGLFGNFLVMYVIVRNTPKFQKQRSCFGKSYKGLGVGVKISVDLELFLILSKESSCQSPTLSPSAGAMERREPTDWQLTVK
ncbi:hypothetical protein P7K49_008813 [Saguinus oedipus]|uniref:Uncharacterized protein n=1 Tax=Saguinus oedipus TaxID=9490 RepID=A0ABQ9W2E0_SAGOE|nr:hypothetical protein P7K49_008813 [Saguinus oedipus]